MDSSPPGSSVPRQEYWSELPCPPLQGIFQTQEWNLRLLHWQADSLYHWAAREAHKLGLRYVKFETAPVSNRYFRQLTASKFLDPKGLKAKHKKVQL